MSNSRSHTRSAAIVVALVASIFAPAATFAADGKASGNVAPARHCVSTPKHATQCFATFSAGVSFATGGRETTNDPGVAMRQVTAVPLSGGLEIRAVLFVNSGYGGSTFTIYDYDVCTWKQPSMPSGWDNVVSSAQVGSRCGISLYENPTYGGAQLNIRASTTYVGDAMNDRTSSWALFVQ